MAHASLSARWEGNRLSLVLPSPLELAPSFNRAAFNLFHRLRRSTEGNLLLAPGVISERPTGLTTDEDGTVRLDAQWKSPFPPGATSEGVFFVDVKADRVTSIATMRRRFGRGSEALSVEGRAVQVLELPYEGDLSVVFFLPRDPDGLREIEDRLTWASAAVCMRSLRPLEVEVTLPRCEVVSTTHVGDEQHRVAFALDEAGTEPATTGSRAIEPPEDPRIPQLAFDHPFLFLVKTRSTGHIVLLGRVVDPS